jgi:urate oxidase
VSEVQLGHNRYGKSAIRLVRVARDGARHSVRDLTVAVALEGEFAAAHVEGDNANVVATDTMKNTVYAFAREHLDGAIERFGHALAVHFLGMEPVGTATVSIDEHRWSRLAVNGGEAPDAFIRTGDLTRTAVVTSAADGDRYEAGLRDLVVLKTTKSAFEGFPRDRYTTLKDTDDRLLATRISATWRYGTSGFEPVDLDFDGCWQAIVGTLLEVFAEHHSRSVQESIWIVGRAILERHAEVEEVRMSLPNLHHWLVDLAPFGQANPGEVFVATTEPHGLIEATVRRG